VLVKHPKRENAIAMSTNLTLAPLDVVFGYSLRFKIEVLSKQAVHQVGAFMYRFWFKMMKPRKRGSTSDDHLIHFTIFKKFLRKRIGMSQLFGAGAEYSQAA